LKEIDNIKKLNEFNIHRDQNNNISNQNNQYRRPNQNILSHQTHNTNNTNNSTNTSKYTKDELNWNKILLNSNKQIINFDELSIDKISNINTPLLKKLNIKTSNNLNYFAKKVNNNFNNDKNNYNNYNDSCEEIDNNISLNTKNKTPKQKLKDIKDINNKDITFQIPKIILNTEKKYWFAAYNFLLSKKNLYNIIYMTTDFNEDIVSNTFINIYKYYLD